MIKKIAFWLLALASWPVHAQFVSGQILTASQLNNQFALYVPLTGATLTGPLSVPTLTVTSAFNTSQANITGGTISGLSSPLPQASGGTNCAAASGTCLDNITGFNSTGLMRRTGAGTYSFGAVATFAEGGTGATTQSAALTALLGSSIVPAANGGTGTVTGVSANGTPVLSAIAGLQSATSTTLPQSQVIVANYSSVNDGGGGTFINGTATTANGCTIFNDASGRSWYRQISTSAPVNVRWCGAKGDGSTLDTTAFANALATSRSVFVPNGSYAIADNSLTLQTGQSMIGSGRSTYLNGSYAGGVLITCTTRSGHPCISVAAGANWVTLQDFTLAGAGTLGSIASGNTGIAFLGDCNYCKVQSVELYNHYNGLNLAGTTMGWVQNVVSQYNSNAGASMLNTTSTPMQWQFTNVLSQFNGTQGFLISSQAVGGATQMTLGAMTNVMTFANSGVGLGVIGVSGVPIYDLRITNSFFGQDGNSELYLQPYGGNITVNGTQIELAGTSTTGPNNSTAASHTGYGIQLLNGSSYGISGNWINQNSQAGISVTSTVTNISGNLISNNGQNGTAGTAIGVMVNAGGSVDLNGNTINNTGGATTQLYGVNNAGTINVSMGNNLKPNATGTYTGTAATIGGATLNNQ
ncbi:TPA: right-handed parallel beta-helix repeat-containing protein [Burkholderia cepacia]|uniref:beta strand repeat-containing protein n=1 Tax=Burkholderia cepacia TaxID=292 RepID=UPI0011B2528B|nr:right-handed parallel beta-helix repeat-containing protein [Burkholderia cepacia]HDR9510653.1 right-handed parallel beta-helix repeat-containing protein [Burkholderia cepacia]